AVHRDEARAEALDAAVVLVAVALVDLALAPVLGVLRQHRDAEALLPAVATTLAHQGVDEHAPGRIGHPAALAPAALLGGADLVIDQHAHALDLAQPALHRVELAAVLELGAGGEDRAVAPLADILGDPDDRVHALAAHLVGDLRHAQHAVDRLPAGHRHRVVVEDLVGDVDPGRDRLADRQRAGVEVGAVAQVLEHVRGVGERGLPAPGDALAAHLGEGVGAAVHPRDHVVAADAAQRARALRDHGRSVVRAARAVVRYPRELRARQGQLALLELHPAQHLADVRGVAAALGHELHQPPRDHAGDGGRGQLAGGGQDPVALLVVLADDRGAVALEVVEQLLHLALDEGVLLLDHEDVAQAAGEGADAQRPERPGHADLVDADAQLAAAVGVEAEVLQRLQHVQVALAGGDDAQAGVGRVDHHPVDAVGAGEGLRRLDRVAVQAHLLVERRIRPADVEPARWQFEVLRRDDLQRQRVHVHRRGRLHGLGDGLEAHPAPGVAGHRPADQAHVEDVLNAGRGEDRHHRAGELALAAVRQGGRTTGVVVGGQRQHAALLRVAGGVAVLEHVAAAVRARALAVPHGVDAIDLGAGEQAGLLGAPDHGRAQVLVESGLELHVRLLEVLARAPQ